MQIVADTRPSGQMTNSEIIAHLFQAIRAQNMRTGAQVQQACKTMFPDLPEDRMRDCMIELAKAIS